MLGKETQRNTGIGITHIHHFFTTREHLFVALLINKIKVVKDSGIRVMLMFALTSSLPYTSRMRRFRADRKGGGPLSGTLYVSSLITPPHVLRTFERNAKTIGESLVNPVSKLRGQVVSTQSANCLPNIPENSVDYIFTDPPFGHNFDYSELNFFWEAFLSVFTSQTSEAIVSTSQKKGVEEYRHLMEACLQEYYRVLKPGHWITVEFSNTKAAVWNAIQTALERCGFVVANVASLDKKQHSFKAVMTPTAVKQDLIITAYKPNGGLEERFEQEAETEEGVWDFVRTHLKYLPVTKHQGALLQFVPERDSRILFDQMVAYYVRKGYPVPISSQEFQIGLTQRFIERDGMYFLPDQVAEYDRKKMTSGGMTETVEMFVKDEASMTQWLRQLLKQKQQTFADINPQFMQQLGGWDKNEAQLDLRELLNQNFLCYDGKGPVPEQIHAYLSSNWKDKCVFDLVIDFGTSQSPKSTRPLTTYWCPSRPGHQALRNNFASSLPLRTWLSYDWTPRSEAYFVFPLAGAVFVNKVVRFNHAALSSFCSLARIALGGFNQTFSILSQFLIAPGQRAGFRVRAAA